MGSSDEIKWHTAVLPRTTKKALDCLSKEPWLGDNGWYLAGGTAMALQAGHRQSEDLDFFTPDKNFPVQPLLSHFNEDSWYTDVAEEGTIYGRFHGGRVSFISYPFFISAPHLSAH